MKNHPNIWTIIVTYNAEDWLDNCLESLRSSALTTQVIVVDNCSNDNTLERLKAYPEVHTFPSPTNLGFGRANNIAIQYALKHEAEYVFLLNQDAKVHPQMMTRLFQAASENPEYGLLSPVHLSYDGQMLDRPFSSYVMQTAPNFFSDAFFQRVQPIYMVHFVPGALWLLRRETVETVGGFDPIFFMYGEDDDLAERILRSGWHIGVVPQAHAYHWHGGPERQPPTLQRKAVSYYSRWVRELKRVDESFVGNLRRVFRLGLAELLRASLHFNRTDVMAIVSASKLIVQRLRQIRRSRKSSSIRNGPFLNSKEIAQFSRLSSANDTIS